MSYYKPYPEYKDSGVEWLGEVPAHWEISPLMGRVSLVKNLNKDLACENLLSLSYGNVVRKDIKKSEGLTPASYETYNIVNNGDIVLRLTDLQNDKKSLRTGLVEDDEGIITSAYLTIRPDDKLPSEFLHYLLHAYDLIKVFYGMGGGMRQSLTFWDMKRLPLPIPSHFEIEAITAFLKREITRIDTLIKKKECFIDLLKERRQSFIKQTVTKGLDPDVKMKDSGVSAIGQIPAHWKIKPLRAEMSAKKEIVGDNWEQYSLLSLTRRGIILRDTSENFGKFPESFETYQSVKKKDLVMCLFDIDETPRTVGLSSIEGMITGAYSVFFIENDAYREYLYHLFIHLDDAKGMKPYYSGLRKTIRPSRLLGIHFPFPPEEEAQAICNNIKKGTARIEKLIVNTQRSIKVLKERRTALITAAVTGKIDLRDEHGKEAA